MPYTPSVEIELEDLIDRLKESQGKVKEDRRLGTFIGNDPATNYPHIHVWNNGKIAFSQSHGVNGVIGRNGTINIDDLKVAVDRYGAHLDGALKDTIDWIFSAAS